ncbi:MAG: ferrochelatase, partial [Chloroflexi bacterium]|nr:ferrochelatase [Chloroflexota bacterium]
EPYYTDIRGGRKPSPENLRELITRYQKVGGKTPLLEITREQARALEKELGENFRVYVGMKHWHPYIAQAIEEIGRDGSTRVIALPLAPHYSRFSIEGYFQRVRDAIQKLNAPLDVTYVDSWNDHPLFLRAIAEKMEEARRKFGASGWDDIQVIFSAHSLPEKILQSNDPYPQELRETCEGVASLIGLKQWRFAYQSAGRTGEKWLGPDILETLAVIASEAKQSPNRDAEIASSRSALLAMTEKNVRRVLIAPIGFVADHLEILYDIDVECAARAHELGIELKRTGSLNADPTFIYALGAIVSKEIAKRP